LLEDIIGGQWAPSVRIIDIVNKLPEFLKEFITQLEKGVLALVGSYYLGERYDLAFLEILPISKRKF
jgi:hypothetical protein